jgi:osmoprotectant transport system ATP-binding protein
LQTRTTEPGIEVEALRKAYAGSLALDIDRLSVPARETLVLIGPSGCGKSTLLRLVVGLIQPDAGRITIAGVPMEATTRRSLLLRMGYVIQEGGLFPHLTARENIAIVARDQGWDRPRIDSRIAELLTLTSISGSLLGRYPAELSGGQRQRVALMRALMLDPEVLLMDEPLAALDPMIRAGLQRDLRRVFRQLRKTVLFVTHDLGEAAAVGDEIALLRNGRIVQRGIFRDLVESPADPFVTEFVQAQRPPDASGGEPT